MTSWRHGIVFSRHSSDIYLVEAYETGTHSTIAVRSSDAPPIALAVSNDEVVGQTWGSPGLWVSGIGRPTSLELPDDAAHDGMNPIAYGGSLAWEETGDDPDATESTLVVLQRSSRGPSHVRRVERSEIYVTQWWSECVLVVREPAGLFILPFCGDHVSKSHVLTAAQSRLIYNPSRFASSGGGMWLVLSQRDSASRLTLMQLVEARTPSA